MKKAVLLLLVAAVVGTAGFMAMVNYFKGKQIESRVNELAGLIRNMSGATQTALDRNWWAGEMPPTEYDFDPSEFIDGVSMGRQEWLRHWEDDAASGGGNLVRVVEDLVIGDTLREEKWAGQDATPVTWTWHQGVPGEWGERVKMRAVFVSETQDWRIRLLEFHGRTEADPPVVDPK